MGNYTQRLNLFKKDPVADAQTTFNITTMLNENWDKIDKLGVLIGGSIWKEIARFEEPGEFTWTADFTGKIGALVVGGGGSGCATCMSTSSSRYSTGGASGEAVSFVMPVVVGHSYSGVVGAGGAKALSSPGTTTSGTVTGKKGDDSSFANVIALGGHGGGYQNSYIPYVITGLCQGASVFSGYYGTASPIGTNSGGDGYGKPWMCINPFTMEQMLGAGGGRCWQKTDGTYTGVPPSLNPITGKGGGSVGLGENGGDATEPGCGGGAAIKVSGTGVTLLSGAGGNGMVIIYKKVEVSEDAD